MKTRYIIGIVSSIGILAFLYGKFMNTLLNLFLLGLIPGTSYTIPYWAMMVLYCVIITMIITVWVESIFNLHREIKQANVKSRRLPRHYSHS